MLDGVNKKTIIQLVVIVAAFAAAGLVLYNGLFKGNGNTAPGFVDTSTNAGQEILPYGDTPLEIQFKALDPKRFQYNQIEYQKLNPQNDVGIPPDSLITPIESASPAK